MTNSVLFTTVNQTNMAQWITIDNPKLWCCTTTENNTIWIQWSTTSYLKFIAVMFVTWKSAKDIYNECGHLPKCLLSHQFENQTMIPPPQ